MARNHTRALTRLVIFAAAVACAPNAAKTAVTPGQDPLLITSGEIDPVLHEYVIDVVKQARPTWLTMNSNLGSGTKRAQGFAVYEDDRRVGGLEMLSTIRTSEVSTIRFVDGNRAAWLPGMGSDVVLGAIILTMKH